MEKGITFAGLDAHKVAINVAMLLPDKALAVEWDQPNDTTMAAWTRRNKRTTTRLPRLDSSRSISAANAPLPVCRNRGGRQLEPAIRPLPDR